MTLVVAGLADGIMSAVSGTGIMKHKMALPAKEFIAKLCVLNSDVAVGFAGDPYYGVEGIQTLPPIVYEY